MMEDQDYGWFVQQIKQTISIDLSLYKSKQMKRRLTTLMISRGYSHFKPYYEALMQDSQLMNEFLDRITINVSEFWRNPDVWRRLIQKFIPELSYRSPRLKVWSAACSSGEEPYTLAMIFDHLGMSNQVEILAADLDKNMLEKAKTAVYPAQSVKEVPEEYLKKYFREQNGMYHLDAALKQNVRFSQMNLLSDPFPEKLDLIVCRNVMIYFTDQAKQMLYLKFAHALKPGGILLVGSTEQILQPEQYQFESADPFFYRKVG